MTEPTITPLPSVDESDEKAVADSINEYFTSIASGVSPLDHSKPPTFLPSKDLCPKVQPCEVYKELLKVKSSKAGVPANVPARLVKEFACELSQPLILNASFDQGIVPNQWRKATVIPLPKLKPAVWKHLYVIMCLYGQTCLPTSVWVIVWVRGCVRVWVCVSVYPTTTYFPL